MLREPKTDRPLGIALFGSLYTIVAVAHDGDTLAPPAYRYVRLVLPDERALMFAVVLVAGLQLLALFTHGVPRILACVVVTFLSVAFGIMVARAAPTALLPGFAFAVALCNGLALFDSFRLRFHK